MELSGPPHIRPNDRVILFDGVCRLCNGWTSFVIRHDHKCSFKLASMQSPEGQDLLRYFGMPIDSFESLVLIDQSNCYLKSEAYFRMMSGLGYPWKLTIILKALPRLISDWIYDRIALNRFRLFGRYQQCILPEPKHEHRFVRASAT